MSKAVRIHAIGGPDVLRWEDVPKPSPGPGEILIRHDAVGLNYIDVYFRTGLYTLPTLPAVIGQEGAGVVEEVGPDVTPMPARWAPTRRTACCPLTGRSSCPRGSIRALRQPSRCRA
jgi:NADPH:quinone reductase-like Zn-dependent oxidoreductase